MGATSARSVAPLLFYVSISPFRRKGIMSGGQSTLFLGQGFFKLDSNGCKLLGCSEDDDTWLPGGGGANGLFCLPQLYVIVSEKSKCTVTS